MSAHRSATASVTLQTLACIVMVGAILTVPCSAPAQAGLPYAVHEDEPAEAAQPGGDGEERATEPDRPAAPREIAPGEREAPKPASGGQARGVGSDQAVPPQEPAPGQRQPVGPTPDEGGAQPAAPVVETTAPTGLQVFERLWQQHRNGTPAEARAALAEMIALKRQSGWPNFFTYGDVLSRESAAALASGDEAEALRLAEAAAALAPDRPEAHRALARAAWAQKGGAWRAVRELFHAYDASWSEPPMRIGRLGNIAAVLLVTVALAVALFCLTVLLRHLRLLVHDLHHLLPRGATRSQAAALAVALLLAPVFFRLGVAWTVLTWVVVMGLYYPWRERAGAMVVLALMAVLPFVLPWAVRGLAYSGSRAEAIYLAARDAGAGRAVRRIESEAQPLPEELFVLGLRARWSGDLHRAEVLLARAREAGSEDPVLLTLLGNVKVELGDNQAAIAYYDQAIDRDPEHVVAYFNLSRVYYSMAEHQKAGEAHRKATAIDYDRVEEYGREARRVGPGYIVREEVPRRLLTLGFPLRPEDKRAVRQLWSLVDGRHTSPPLVFSAAALGGLLLLLLMSWLRDVLHPAIRCPRCGMPACRRCSPEMPDQRQCGQCFHAFVAGDRVDPQARVRKEIALHRYQARRTRVRQVLSLVLVGMPQLLEGASLRGLLWLSSLFGLSLGVLLAAGLLPEPVAAVPGPQWLSVAVLGVTMLACYVAGVWDSQRGIETRGGVAPAGRSFPDREP